MYNERIRKVNYENNEEKEMNSLVGSDTLAALSILFISFSFYPSQAHWTHP